MRDTSPTFYATEGIHNFRDYGGYPTQGGGRVHTGLLYRSGQHWEASEADLQTFAALGIRTVIDLRGESERAAHPCRRVEGFDGEVLFYDGETTSSPPHMDIGPDTSAADFARDRMLAVYTRMPDNPAMIDMFGRYLNILVEREGASLVHCYAGKDRTGILTALLLESLGTPRDVIMDDYIHSRRITPKLKVQEDWIQVVFDRIDQSGGIDNYLTEIGVSAAQRQAVKKNLEQK